MFCSINRFSFVPGTVQMSYQVRSITGQVQCFERIPGTVCNAGHKLIRPLYYTALNGKRALLRKVQSTDRCCTVFLNFTESLPESESQKIRLSYSS